MVSFPSKIFKISLSEILLLSGLRVLTGEGNGVLVLVGKRNDGSEAESVVYKAGRPFLFECLCVEMAQLFCVSKNNMGSVHCCSSHPGVNDTASTSFVFPVLVWTSRLQCPSAPEVVNQWKEPKRNRAGGRGEDIEEQGE